MAKFSFIIPTRYRARDLANLLRDIGQLDCMPNDTMEVIVFNDEHDPDTEMICQSAHNFPLIYLFSDGRANSSVSRNRCLERARGEWVVFVDDDVRLQPDFLVQVNHWRTRYSAFGFRVDLPRPRTIAPLNRWLQHHWPGRIFPWLGLMIGGFSQTGTKPLRVDHIPGTNMIFHSSLVRDARFDEVIGQGTGYLDDTDFCYTVKNLHPIDIWLIPMYGILHLQTPAGGNRQLDKPTWFYYYQHHKFIFFRKHFSHIPSWWMASCGWVEMILRSLAYRTNLWPTFYRAWCDAKS